MTCPQQKRSFVLLIICAVGAAPLAQATDPTPLPLIRVTEGQSSPVASRAMVSEPVERLLDRASVSMSRMGGRGLEPVIRGQSQERVDVLIDGIRVEGACPNRMDPPTSRLSTVLAPALEVRTSNQTLRWGPITGGQIIATTAPPKFDDQATTGEVRLGGVDNGHGTSASVAAAVGADDGWLRLAGGRDEAGDYEDGSGNRVRSAYENREARVDAGWRGDNGVYVRGLVSRQEERDVKYAGAGMDAPKTDTNTFRLELGAPVASGGWQLVGWQADVDHIMDNFSLRRSQMNMLTLSETRTRGLRLTLDQSPDIFTDWAVGVDVEANDWQATRFGGPELSTVTSFLWPDVQRDRVGIFAEHFVRVRPALQLGAGLRYDRVEMDADAANQPFAGGMTILTAADAYQALYGSTTTRVLDDNLSGFISADWRITAQQSLEMTISRSVRSPGVSERYIASWNPMDPARRWVGNPALAPEVHNKLELAFPGRRDGWQWRPAVWVDQVDNFVLRTRNADQTSVYRNISARLMGLDAELGWSSGTWRTNTSLSLVRGDNRDTNQPLPRIPPLQLAQVLGWQHQGHTLELEWLLARRQDRVDVDSGQDAGRSPGYGILNVSGAHGLTPELELNWAITNLLDKTWAPHVSRANQDPFLPEALRVNEPGRSVRVGLSLRW